MAADSRPPPSPITPGDDLLVIIIDELRGLRADVQKLARPAPPEPPPGHVELREPKPVPKRGSGTRKAK